MRPWPAQVSQRPPLTLNEKRAGGVAAQPRLGRAGEEPADLVEEADVRGRDRARRAADRRLVDLDDALDRLRARQRAGGARRGRRRTGRACGERAVEHVAHQRRLAGARDAGDAGPGAERHLDVDVLQVVLGGADDLQPGQARRRRAAARCAAAALPEEAAGDRARLARERCRRTHGDQLAAARCRRRDRGRRRGRRCDRRLVVLDDDHRVACVAAARAACRAAWRCRAGAGRWSARRGCSRRRAGSSRAAPPAGCAAPRRRRACRRAGRASGSRARPARGSCRRGTISFRMLAATRSSRSPKRYAGESARASATDRRGHLPDRCRRPAPPARAGSAAGPRRPGTGARRGTAESASCDLFVLPAARRRTCEQAAALRCPRRTTSRCRAVSSPNGLRERHAERAQTRDAPCRDDGRAADR